MKERVTRKLVLRIAILGLMCFGFIGCADKERTKTSGASDTAAQQTQEVKENEPEAALKKVTIGYSQLRISLPIFVADANGYFEENGLDVKLEEYETAQPLMEALCGDKIDIAGYTAFQITMTAQLSSGKDLYYTTAMMEDDEHPISMFLVKKDSEVKEFSDFKGKTIGILPTLAYKVWAEKIMEENGILDAVTIQNVAPNLQGDALQSGEADILFTNDPVATTLIQKGVASNLFEGAVVTDYTWTPYPFASFNMSADFVEKNPDIAASIVKALDEAIAFIKSNQKAAKEIMADYLPTAQKEFVSYYPDALYIPSSEFLSENLVNVADSYYEAGTISEEIDLTDRTLSK